MSYARVISAFVFVALLAGSVTARPIEQSRLLPQIQQVNVSGNTDFPRSGPVFQAASSGTTFYGGTFWAADSMRWEAYENQLWTFDSGVGSSLVPAGGPGDLSEPTASWVNPFKAPGLHATVEGWIGYDHTYAETPYFRRLASNDSRWGQAVCVGAAGGLQGSYSFWAGVFPEEATLQCFTSGQGYGNNWSVCIEHAFDYLGGNVNFSFQFKNDTEADYDYTYVYCDTSANGTLREIAAYTGTMGGLANFLLTPGSHLPTGPKEIKIKFCVETDATWSDQDGGNPTACGAFAIDNIVLSGGINHSTDFETGSDGWVLEELPQGEGGEWSDLSALSDLPAFLTPCDCALSDSVLTFMDDQNGNPFYQDNLAASPWIDLKAYGKVGTYGKLVTANVYSVLPTYSVLIQVQVQWYPDVCPVTGKLRTSPWTSTGFLFNFDGFPHCTAPNKPGFLTDFSGIIPPEAEQVRIALGVVSACQFFSCIPISNTTPWFDNVGLGVYGIPNVPYIFTDEISRAQDNFPANSSLSSLAPGRVDSNVRYGEDQYSVLGDSLVVRGAMGNAEVYVHFRVRPGPGTDETTFDLWYDSHAVSPIEASFKVARCDTAEHGASGPVLGIWATAYHESDPNFSAHGAHDRTTDPTDVTPTGGTWRLSHDIFPDKLLTAGSRLDYFFSSNNVGSSGSFVEPSGAPAVTYEMEILPSSMTLDESNNCVLYVDRFGRGGQPYIEAALGSILGHGSTNVENTKWDRFDLNAPGFGAGTFGKPFPWNDYGASIVQLIFGYRVVLWDTGDLNANTLTDEDANILKPWLILQNFDYNNLYLSGNGIVFSAFNPASDPVARSLIEDVAGVSAHTGCAAGTYRNADCPTPGSPEDPTPCAGLTPMPHALVANSGIGRSVNQVAQGNGCPERRSFDVLTEGAPDYGVATPDEMYSSPVKTARYASIATDASPSNTLHYRIVTDGLSVHYRRDEGTPCDFNTGGTTAVTERMREVLEYFGFANGYCPPRNTGVIPDEAPTPPTLLSGISPNPLTAGAMGRIQFSMAKDAPAVLEILDLQGRLVKSLFNGTAKKGPNEVTWDGRDTAGTPVGSGVYFYRLRALDQDLSRKLVVMDGRN